MPTSSDPDPDPVDVVPAPRPVAVSRCQGLFDRERASRLIGLSQPGYIESILEQLGTMDCDRAQTPKVKNIKLSSRMSTDTPQGAFEMKYYPYRELIGELLHSPYARTLRIL